jgi:hypothetical protein
MYKIGFKSLAFFQGQGVTLSKSGAHTLVREYFGQSHNAAIGQKMSF